MKVLLFANDLMPFGSLPTSGGGLRCFQLMRGLEAHGIDVVASMPGFTFLAEKHHDEIPDAQRDYLWRWEMQDAIVRRVKPDVILFASNWDHFNLRQDHGIPIAIDLHGSRLIETTMWGNPVSTDHKLTVFSKADCLLCAGRRQRSYFYGWLVQAGRVPGDEHFIRYIPVSLAPDRPDHVAPDPTDRNIPHIVSGGGWFPWQNQAKAIFAACREVAARDRGVIDIYGTPHDAGTSSPEERAIRDVYARVQALAAESPRVRVQGYVGRERLLEIYRRASVALESMRYNLERELAFTTRTIEYLWCGLPVVYNNYGEIAEHIREYDAGWAVDPGTDAEITTALAEIFDDPAAVARKSANAQRLVRDRFTWDRTIEPLVDFVRHPERAPKIRPALGTVSAGPSYFGPTKITTQVPLRAPLTELRQPFVVPAENARRIELPFSMTAESRGAIASLTMTVRSESGRVLARRRYDGTNLPEHGHLQLVLPLYRGVRGGERLVLELALRARAGAADGQIASVGGVDRARFPLLADDGGSPPLALTFSRAMGRLDALRQYGDRALDMVRRGQTRALLGAAARRARRIIAQARGSISRRSA